MISDIDMWLLVIITGVLSLLSFFYLRSWYRVESLKRECSQQADRFSRLLSDHRLSIWQFDVLNHEYVWFDEHGTPQHRYSEEAFARRLEEGPLAALREAARHILDDGQPSVTVQVDTLSEREPKTGIHHFEVTLSPLRYDQGRPSVLIAVCYDQTEDRRCLQSAQDRLLRYQSLFNNVLVDMVVYDAHGQVIDMNERMQRTLHVSLSEILEHHYGIREITGMRDFDFEHFDTFWATRIVTGDERIDHDMRATSGNSIIYELQLLPLRDKEGRLLRIYSTGNNRTEEVNSYRDTQQTILQLKATNQELAGYVENINLAMEVGGVRMVNYSPSTHSLRIFQGLNEVQYELTQTRSLSLTDEHSKKLVMRILKNMDHRTDSIIEERVKTSLRVHGKPLYLLFRFVPVYDREGVVTNYYGICRDISDLKDAEHQLKQQTATAQEVENLKNAFLHNMSYEIRTPLNVVVGFAELFEQGHSPADEELFIREIKNNSAFLLELINSILFLSRLDAHMIEIKPAFFDFTETFDAHCQQGWLNCQVPGVQYVVEQNYDRLEVELDEGHVGNIIEQVVRNAAQNTVQGFVRVRCDYLGGQLMIIVEDTGCGISEEQLTHIYERFATSGKGSGLGLPISKELIEQMGGTIEISSRPGEGTRVWISIPCKSQIILRKRSSQDARPHP